MWVALSVGLSSEVQYRLAIMRLAMCWRPKDMSDCENVMGDPIAR